MRGIRNLIAARGRCPQIPLIIQDPRHPFTPSCLRQASSTRPSLFLPPVSFLIIILKPLHHAPASTNFLKKILKMLIFIFTKDEMFPYLKSSTTFFPEVSSQVGRRQSVNSSRPILEGVIIFDPTKKSAARAVVIRVQSGFHLVKWWGQQTRNLNCGGAVDLIRYIFCLILAGA